MSKTPPKLFKADQFDELVGSYRKMLAERIDGAVVAFTLEKGRAPQFVRMSYATFHNYWGTNVRRHPDTGQWLWRDIPINIQANMPLGEVEVV